MSLSRNGQSNISAYGPLIPGALCFFLAPSAVVIEKPSPEDIGLDNVLLLISDGIPGEVVATFTVPSQLNSLNGMGWDGEQLWVVDYELSNDGAFDRLWARINRLFSSEVAVNEVDVAGMVYRLDIAGAATGTVPQITRSLRLGLPGMEGAAHDGKHLLLVGPRPHGDRASASVVAINDETEKLESSFSEFQWPDREDYGSYKDPDGFGYDDNHVYWSTNGDHSKVKSAALQVFTMEGKVTKRLWLPDTKVNDIAVEDGYLIYKPSDLDIIRIIDTAASQDGSDAIVVKNIRILNGDIKDHWGVTHDGQSYLYISQDPPGGLIWKVFLPIDKLLEP